MQVATESRRFERIAPDRYRHESNGITYEWQECGLLSASHTPQIWPTRTLANAARTIDRIEGIPPPPPWQAALGTFAPLLPLAAHFRR